MSDFLNYLEDHTGLFATLASIVAILGGGGVASWIVIIVRKGTRMVQKLERQIGKLIDQLGFSKRTMRASDSMSIRNEGQRNDVKQLGDDYEALPEKIRKQRPGLLNELGKLDLAAGRFAEAQQKFQTAAKMESDPKLQAEFHYNAYQAALQQQDWTRALESIRKASALDPARFAPFPLDIYEPTRILGAGGFGVAYLCYHKLMKDNIVIKTLQDEELDCNVDRVFTEAQTLRRLNHPSIIRVTDCGFADPIGKSRPYLAMDYFEGANLENYVAKNGLLSLEDLLAVAFPVAEALQAAHAGGILHRDVKPANILVRREGEGWRVKLIDFGLALRPSTFDGHASTSGPRAQTTMGKSSAGTPDYAPPEQMGKAPGVAVGTYSDVYAFGKTCYFALLGTPNPGDGDMEELPNDWRRFLGMCSRNAADRRLTDFAAVLRDFPVVKGVPGDVLPEVANVLEKDGRWEVVWQVAKQLNFMPKAWLEWLPSLGTEYEDPRVFLIVKLRLEEGHLDTWLELQGIEDLAKRSRIAEALLAEAQKCGFKPQSARKKITDRFTRISGRERVLEWAEGQEPKADAIRMAAKKALDDLYPKLGKLAAILRPLFSSQADGSNPGVLVTESVDRSLWDRLRELVEPAANGVGMQLHPDCPYYYPAKRGSPREIKYDCAGEFEEKTEQLGFSVTYMLHCPDSTPGRGSQFSIRLMAWCEEPQARKYVRDLVLEDVLPPSSKLKSWSKWENIWTGGSYGLQDLGKRDLDAMAQLVIDAVHRTYPVLEETVAECIKVIKDPNGGTRGGDVPPGKRYWVIAPCRYDNTDPEAFEKVWQYNLAQGIISIGWWEMNDVSALDEDGLLKRIADTYDDCKGGPATTFARMFHKFFHGVKPGDTILARRGRKALAGIGTVKRAAYYDPKKQNPGTIEDGKGFPNHIDVEWAETPRDKLFDAIVFAMQTFYEIPEDRFLTLLEARASGAVERGVAGLQQGR